MRDLPTVSAGFLFRVSPFLPDTSSKRRRKLMRQWVNSDRIWNLRAAAAFWVEYPEYQHLCAPPGPLNHAPFAQNATATRSQP